MRSGKEIILGLSIGFVTFLFMAGIGFFIYNAIMDKDRNGVKAEATETIEQMNNQEIEQVNKGEQEAKTIRENNDVAQDNLKEENVIVTKEYFPLYKNLSYRMIEEDDLHSKIYVYKYQGKNNIDNNEVYVVSSETIYNDQVMAQYQYFYAINEDGDIYKIGERNSKGIKWKDADNKEIILFGKMKIGETFDLKNNEFMKHSMTCVGLNDVTLPNGDVYEETLQVNEIMDFNTNMIIMKHYYAKGIGLVYFEFEQNFDDGRVSRMINYVPKDSIKNEGQAEHDGFLSEEEIFNIVFHLDEVQSIETPEISVEVVVYPTQENPVFKVKVFEDLGDHVTTYNYLTLDAKTGKVLSADFNWNTNDEIESENDNSSENMNIESTINNNETEITDVQNDNAADDTIELLKQGVALYPERAHSAYFSIANLLFDQGKYSEGISYIIKAVESAPEQAYEYYSSGATALFNHKRKEDGKKLLEYATKNDPSNASAYEIMLNNQ